MRFELTIPPADVQGDSAVVTVDAPNWLVALQKALTQLGEEQIPRGKAVCEIKEDGAILVRNPVDGRQFHIRKSEVTEEQPALPPDALPRRQTPFGTMTYLEAELGPKNDAGAAPTPVFHPGVRLSNSGHPCMVLDREEIERRAKAEAERMRKSQQRSDTSPAMVAVRPENDVRFIQVVDVDAKKARDTLTSLRVDLDALRKAAATTPRTGNGQAPNGYTWLEEPLSVALGSCRSAREAGTRTLPLLLAALPSRTAMLLIPAGKEQLAPLTVLGHTANDAHRPVPRQVKGSPLEMPFFCGMSMVLDNSPGALLPAAELAPWLGYEPRAGLVAAVTDGPQTFGVLVLADPLSTTRFTATDLAVANWFASRMFIQLQYWVGSR